MKPRNIFILLAAINLLNYIDRQILFAVFPLIKIDLHLTDTQLGFLGSAFMIVYMLAAPVIGYFADRTPRQIWIASTAFLWSAATMLTGLVKNYGQMIFARGLIGVGEAGFTSVSPSFAAEQFPVKARAKVLSLFALALPLGSALGYLLGAGLGHRFGWRTAFYIVGLPGVILAAVALFALKDKRMAAPKEQRPKAVEYLKLLKNKPFLFTCLSQAMGTFTLGGLAAWMPTYLHRYFDFNVAQAGAVFGGLTIIAGAAGTFLGGLIADRLFIKTNKAYFLTAAASFILALPFAFAALFATGKAAALILLGFAIMFVFLQTGPMNAAVVQVTYLKIRSMAFALNIFIIHALGDALSPAFIGRASDIYGLKTAVFTAVLFIIPAALFALAAARAHNGRAA
ncbi:MAG: MFS transporter [Elusimicrobiota bacterium]|jgi:predicted MFS family arabinose efflux permease|nr:MFS transporter [Elusimicrobiota bacterium]